MTANVNEQALAVASCLTPSMRFQAHVVPQRAAEKDVVPSAHVVRGYLDPVVMIFNGPPLPVIVVSGMFEPVCKIGCQALGAARLRGVIAVRRIILERIPVA